MIIPIGGISHMRKVSLMLKYEEQYQVIKEFVDHSGNKKRVALKLNISVRQVNRLIKKYREKGKAAFVHGNSGRKPVNCLTTEINTKIVTLYRDKYQDFNFKHFTEFINEHEGIKVSYSTIYNLLSKAEVDSPKIQKKTRKQRAKARYQRDHPKADQIQVEEAVEHRAALEDAHPRHERCKNFGEEIQMDASDIVWFGEKKTSLHLAIDNATGIIVGAWFDWQETLNGYYHVFKQILDSYGIPYRFKTDNRTVFNYNSSNRKDDEKDVLTQFGYACRQLGTDIVTTSVSQAKGMVERANQTFQGRLKQELRIAQINDIDAANKYLLETFVPDFNQRFGEDYKDYPSVFEVAPASDKINQTLAILSPRKFDSGSAIKFKRKYYQAFDDNDQLVCFKNHTKCLVIEAFDKQRFITVDDQVYYMKEVQKNAKTSPELDPEPAVKKLKPKGRKPAMSHPWKRASFILQQERAHKKKQYA